MEIVATIRKSKEDINLFSLYDKLLKLGIHSFRFNYAKVEGNNQHIDNLIDIFSVVRRMSNRVSTMLDIPYPGRKIRISSSFSSLNIVAGEKYYLCINAKKLPEVKPIDRTLYINTMLPSKIMYVGLHIIYDIGQGVFTVTDIQPNNIVEIIAENSFILYNLKSISLGYIETSGYYELLNSLCAKLKPDKIALSFINNKSNLDEAIALKKIHGFSIISKVESAEGIANISDIAASSDAIMLGRGDLCLNAVPSNLLNYQNKVSNICHHQKCELYFATDYLTSLSHNYMPTRSDLIDLQYALSLAPTGIILNLDLVISDGIKRAVEIIHECESVQTKFYQNK